MRTRATIVFVLLLVSACETTVRYGWDVPQESRTKFDNDRRTCGKHTEVLIVARGFAYGLSNPTPSDLRECMLALGWKEIPVPHTK